MTGPNCAPLRLAIDDEMSKLAVPVEPDSKVTFPPHNDVTLSTAELVTFISGVRAQTPVPFVTLYPSSHSIHTEQSVDDVLVHLGSRQN